MLETPFHGMNAHSLIVLAQARGALLAVLAGRGLEIREYSPAEVKSAVTGNGRADKEQVARMVRLPARRRGATAGRATRPTPWRSPSAAPSGCGWTGWPRPAAKSGPRGLTTAAGPSILCAVLPSSLLPVTVVHWTVKL